MFGLYRCDGAKILYPRELNNCHPLIIEAEADDEKQTQKTDRSRAFNRAAYDERPHLGRVYRHGNVGYYMLYRDLIGPDEAEREKDERLR